MEVRITPAWAGKRCNGRIKIKRVWDHPRVGGEKPQGLKFP